MASAQSGWGQITDLDGAGLVPVSFLAQPVFDLWGRPDWTEQLRSVEGKRIVEVAPLCDHWENEAWVSEGRLELESRELWEER